MIGAIDQSRREFTLFQKHLIPSSSHVTRYLMQMAAWNANQSSLVRKHIVSLVCLIASAVFSAVNTLSYGCQMPLRILLNTVRISPICLGNDFFEDFSSIARSFVFVAAAPAIGFSGFFLPVAIYSFFAPDTYSTAQEECQNQMFEIKKQVASLIRERDQALATATAAHLALKKSTE